MPKKAKARMIWSSISQSERVAKLGVKGALIFTWLLVHCDDAGRHTANPRVIKNIVFPLMDEIIEKDVELTLLRMEDLGLIKIYTADAELMRTGKWTFAEGIIQMLDWHEYQHLREPRPSSYPPYEDYQDDAPLRQRRDELGRYLHDG